MSEELTDDTKRLYDESLPRVDASVVKQTDLTDDRRPGVTDVMFERETVIDVLSGLPDGQSIDQTLGLGLDGAAIDTARNHYGIGDDDLLAGRSIDSPLAMARDSLFGIAEDTSNDAPPDIATGSANPTRNMDLVSGKDGGTDDKDLVDTVVDTINDWFSGGTTEPPNPPDAGTVRPEGDTAVPKPKPKAQPRPGSEDDYMTNPDADTGGRGGTATDADIERAIAKQGADTDFVEGFARGPVITGDSPMTRPIDLVKDPVDDDKGSGFVTVVGSDPGPLPQDEISRTVNPGDGLPTPTTPPPGSGGQPGTGGDDIGMSSVSSAAIVAGAGAGVINIGTGSTASAPPTGDDGLASESFAMMGGDDDDLDELEVQRADMAAAGPGTQTEDEIYIGATSAPVEPAGNDSTGGSGSGQAVQPSSAALLPTATVAGVFTPAIEFEPVQSLAAPEPDALTVTIDASIHMQETLDSAFDSAFTPLPEDAAEAQRDEPSVDDGF